MNVKEYEDATGLRLDLLACQCHAASIALVKSGALGEARVARGTCPGVFGQHSWVVLGLDCYDTDAEVIDPTLWSYEHVEPYIWTGVASDKPHRPHGTGSIWQWGKPTNMGGATISLAHEPEDQAARDFLALLGPLDRAGWGQLANAPVQGWPAKPIIEAIYATPALMALIPIDIVGMVTDLNPNGLYLAEKEAA